MFVESGYLTETKKVADPFSLEALVAWLEKQPGDGVYDFMDPKQCILCQYFGAAGFKDVSVSPFFFRHGSRKPGIVRDEISYPRTFNKIAQGPALVPDAERWTFSAALQRARAALEEQKMRTTPRN